ncbi:hypothetical protein J7444_09175, partial [Labrenzia sp. R4_1]|uniref:hypothetical protein n=1 Tax=Labrenzia sp. R4_1 TaxID=2821106 RepID=UPI001ADA6E60
MGALCRQTHEKPEGIGAEYPEWGGAFTAALEMNGSPIRSGIVSDQYCIDEGGHLADQAPDDQWQATVRGWGFAP